MKVAKRMENLRSDIFTEMNKIVQEVGGDWDTIINLGIGSPDQPPPPHIIDTLTREASKPQNYGYTSTLGLLELREAICRWYQKRFGVQLDPHKQVVSLMGSQDGLALLPQVYLDPEDIALIPDPGYPIYSIAVELSGGQVYPLPLRKENNFLPDFNEVPRDIAEKAKLMILNYPNNPVAAVAPLTFFEEVVRFAKENDIVVCHDAAYTELAFDGYKPVSFLEAPGAKEVGIEFHSLSKTYNFAGCRLGFAVGNDDVIEALARIKSNTNYGIFTAIQLAGIAALEGPQDIAEENSNSYQRRRDILVDGLQALGWDVPKPKASMFVWAPIPPQYNNSMDCAIDLIKRAGVLAIPGSAFGPMGDQYIRFGVVAPDDMLEQAVERIKQSGIFS